MRHEVCSDHTRRIENTYASSNAAFVLRAPHSSIHSYGSNYARFNIRMTDWLQYREVSFQCCASQISTFRAVFFQFFILEYTHVCTCYSIETVPMWSRRVELHYDPPPPTFSSFFFGNRLYMFSRLPPALSSRRRQSCWVCWPNAPMGTGSAVGNILRAPTGWSHAQVHLATTIDDFLLLRQYLTRTVIVRRIFKSWLVV